ncbi:hypothetical protein GQX59_08775 [Brachyspira hyodysenteriae]|uniref:hypothetical protein n=1 Tax=Brachyspira hyodysenteriae TaxID=159 RepID=UPI001ADDD942|nr:hypothetical protein [Brachyspira hyodysenteriae]QTM11516.1 hypothetical protein GQX59_08775 [Brachyspira hyodysenteriae]
MGTQALMVGIICATILALFFGGLNHLTKHAKNKDFNTKLKGSLKDQTVEAELNFNSNKTIEELEKKVQETKKIVNMSSPNESVEKLNIDIVKNDDFKETITRLTNLINTLKKEVKYQKTIFICEIIVWNIVFEMVCDIAVLIIRNHLNKIGNIEYNKYIEKFINNLNNRINEELKKSSLLEKYNVETILEHDYFMYKTMIKYIFNMMRDYHIDVVYKTNKPKEDLMKDPSLNLSDKIYSALGLMDIFYSDLMSVEIGVVREEMKSLKNFLVGKMIETLEKNNELEKDSAA